MALGVSALAVARRGLSSALRSRLGFALGGLCLFFASRAASKALGSPALALLTLMIASGLPIAALLLAEGVLRRHAPWALKVLTTAGGLVVAVVLFATAGCAPASSWGLGAYVVLSLLGVILLLLTHDRSSLSRQENAGVDALLTAGALLTVLSLTDFLPAAPIGLSGIGAAAVAFVLSANPSSSREGRAVLAALAVTGLIAAGAALALAAPLQLRTTPEQIRLGAILLALLLGAGGILGASRNTDDAAARTFALALARANLSSLDHFLRDLADQPLLAGLRLAEGPALADYDADGLGEAMAAQAVWTEGALLDPRIVVPVRARDELRDLMARTEATHAVMISARPLRIALLTLPSLGANDDAESSLALFRKLAASAAQDHS